MKRFKEGDRVMKWSPLFPDPPAGSKGTVAKVAGVRGKSIYPDPSRRMIFVEWDDHPARGVFKEELTLLEEER